MSFIQIFETPAMIVNLPKIRVALLTVAAAIACTEVLAAGPAQSDSTASDRKFYAEAGALYQTIEVDGLRFSHPAAQVRAGMYFQPQLGIEVHAATGVQDDEKKGLTTDLNYLAGVDVRFESPEVNFTKLYITLGYAHTDMTMHKKTSDYPGDGTFDSPSAGIGAEATSAWNPDLYVFAKYTHYFHDDDVEMGGISAGVKYAF
ncbi:MAG: porin family protein [Hahellaceae bacterium]|nr:porin family protein [Hahellaceae bacterium]MCP5212320.1 porin family protein [Hahellaceae bacterium]